MSLGRSIRLFLADGVPTGLVTAEIINWTGHTLFAPRDRLPDVLRREEAKRTGVYFLFGDVSDVIQRRKIYVGESDDVGRRISDHNKDDSKSFFERFAIVTSKDANLTKAHTRYLENRFVTIARESRRAEVINGNLPPPGSLPEADLADMEFFIQQVATIFPVMGFDVLRPPPSVSSITESQVSAAGKEAVQLEMQHKKSGLHASAVLRNGEYVVRAGSLVAMDTAHASDPQKSLRDELIAQGQIKPTEDGRFFVFQEDVSFQSPSAASSLILGRADNGRTTWRLKGSNRSLKDYQIAEAEAAE